MNRRNAFSGCLLLVALSLFLRLWPVGHGLPANYVPDTHCVRSALVMARDKNPVPPAGLHSSYPNLLPYGLVVVFACDYALGSVRGEWDSPAAYGQELADDPARAHWIARIVFAMISAAAAWIFFLLAREAGLGRGAWVAGFLVATSLLHVHMSTQERPWAPLCTLFAAMLWCGVRFQRTGRARDLLFSALFAGLAAAAHQAGLVALGAVGLFWLMGPLAPSGAGSRERFLLGVKAVIVFTGAAVVFGYPYLVVHGGEVAVSTLDRDALPSANLGVGGQVYFFGLRFQSVLPLLKALFGYDPVLLTFGLLGVPLALRRRSLRAVTFVGLLWLILFLPSEADHPRYLLPALICLALPAGLLAERLMQKRMGVALGLALLPLVQTLRLGWVLRQPDTRQVATEALERDFSGLSVGVDRFGPDLTLDRKSLERWKGLEPLSLKRRMRLTRLEHGEETGKGPAWDALPLNAIFHSHERFRALWLKPSVEAEHGADPTRALASLGIDYVLLADRSPSDEHPALMLDPRPQLPGEHQRTWSKCEPLRVEGPALMTVLPGRAVSSAYLPEEMSFALTQIWKVQRPGPRLDLFRLLR